ncbi:MAG: hypothetical protein JWQ94_946 [Tardiphaga sp.]|nr:hypothetical protein [Tardiphaga sp.]
MLSRALGVATAMLVMSFAAVPAQAQNLEAGKSPSQIFAGSCAVCHKSPRGLLKTVAPGALPGFLRQHYTTSTDMASQLSAYVVSNGANDPRGGGLTKQGEEAVAPRRPADPRPGAAPAATAPAPAETPSLFSIFSRKPAEPAQEAIKHEDAAPMTARQKRAADRAARRQLRENSETARSAVEGQPPVAAEGEPHPGKPKLGKKGRRGQEAPPKADAVKDEPKLEAKPEAPKEEVKPVAKPAEERKPEAVKPETRPEPTHSEPKPETPLRADPVPAVTPAPKPETESRPAPAAEPSSAPVAPAPPASSSAPEPAAPAPSGDAAPATR